MRNCAAFTHCLARWLIPLWLVLAHEANAVENSHVLMLLSGNSAPYLAFAKTFRQNLPSGIRIDVMEQPSEFSDKSQSADVVVTVGMLAAKRVAQSPHPTPTLFTMVPRYQYEDEIKRAGGKSSSALFIDQPWSRQAELLHLATPGHKRVGVLHSENSRLNLPALREALTSRGHTLITKSSHSADTLFADLEEILQRSDVLLAIPDSAIYNPNTIRNILLSSYRHSVPLIGISQSYVKAGALYALYSTPEQMAAQASTIIASFIRSRSLPEPQPPRLYSLNINQDVARTLGIQIKSAELLQMQLESAQVKP